MKNIFAFIQHNKLVLVAIGAFILGGAIVRQMSASSRQSANPTVAGASVTPVPSVRKQIGKDLTIPTSTKKDAKPLVYTLESAELLGEIVVRGQQARAANGKTFFVVNIKIKNDSSAGVSINSRDFVRLRPAGESGEWIAPEIHNDPVEVQAISTKFTRVGFPVDQSVSTFTLQLGEISGEKTTIDVDFASQ